MHLSHFVRSYDLHLSPVQCQHWVDHFDQLAPTANGKGIRAGLEDSAWFECDLGRQQPQHLPALQALAMDAFHRYNRDCGLTLSITPPYRFAEWILKRYRAGTDESFQYHFDSIGAVANRYLVFLWYLNTVEVGGETLFPDLGVSIRPQAGRLLVFPPYWLFQHAGLPPISGDKYILSTYALY